MCPSEKSVDFSWKELEIPEYLNAPAYILGRIISTDIITKYMKLRINTQNTCDIRSYYHTTAFIDNEWFIWYLSYLFRKNHNAEAEYFNIIRVPNIENFQALILEKGSLGTKLIKVMQSDLIPTNDYGLSILNSVFCEHELYLRNKYNILSYQELMLYFLGVEWQPFELVKLTADTYCLPVV